MVKKGNVYKTEKHKEIAFKPIIKELSNDRVLKYYDLTRKFSLECDATEVGAGFTLLQNFGVDLEQDINESFLTAECLANLLQSAYGSLAFTECERIYANIEKELLAVVCGTEKLNYCKFGRNTIILSKHKPLLSIILKDLINAPPRLQRMLLRFQKYYVTVVYCKGSEIVFVDHLSRNLDTKSETEKLPS